jgi:hypothetical protein
LAVQQHRQRHLPHQRHSKGTQTIHKRTVPLGSSSALHRWAILFISFGMMADNWFIAALGIWLSLPWPNEHLKRKQISLKNLAMNIEST